MLVLGNEEGVEFLWTRKQDGGWVLGQWLDFSRRKSSVPVPGVGDSGQMYYHQAREGTPACPNWRLRGERLRRTCQGQGEGHQAPKGCSLSSTCGICLSLRVSSHPSTLHECPSDRGGQFGKQKCASRTFWRRFCKLSLPHGQQRSQGQVEMCFLALSKNVLRAFVTASSLPVSTVAGT